MEGKNGASATIVPVVAGPKPTSKVFPPLLVARLE